MTAEAEPRQRRHSTNSTRIEGDSGSMQQGNEFFLEIPFLMMLSLIADVAPDCVNSRGADAKRTISFLPGEAHAARSASVKSWP